MTKAEYSALVVCFKQARHRAKQLEQYKSQITIESVVSLLADEIGRSMEQISTKSKARRLWSDALID